MALNRIVLAFLLALWLCLKPTDAIRGRSMLDGGGVGKGINTFEVRSIYSTIDVTNHHAEIAKKAKGQSQQAAVIPASMFTSMGFNTPDRKLLAMELHLGEPLRDVDIQVDSDEHRHKVDHAFDTVADRPTPAKPAPPTDLLGRRNRKLLRLIIDALRDVNRQRTAKDLRGSVELRFSAVSDQPQPATVSAKDLLAAGGRKLQQNTFGDLNDAVRDINRRKGQSKVSNDVASLVDDIEGRPKPAKVEVTPVFQLDGGRKRY